jgi:hypothetical protein
MPSHGVSSFWASAAAAAAEEAGQDEAEDLVQLLRERSRRGSIPWAGEKKPRARHTRVGREKLVENCELLGESKLHGQLLCLIFIFNHAVKTLG